jgi:hypothetical protein
MRSTTLSVAFGLACTAMGQVEIDRPVELIGASAAERQVTGLDTVASASAALTAHVEQSGSHRHAFAASGTVWSVSIPALTAPQPGTHITVAVPEGSTGEAWIAVNASDPAAIILAPGIMLDATGLETGYVLSLVHNGSEWQVMNGLLDRLGACPADMAAVNGQFCIERAQRTSLLMVDAVAVCAAQGKRLCTWGEFVAACQRRADLGLLNPSSDWEWTGNSSNEENNVRMTKLSNCTMAGHRNMTGPAAPYRCCLTR